MTPIESWRRERVAAAIRANPGLQVEAATDEGITHAVVTTAAGQFWLCPSRRGWRLRQAGMVPVMVGRLDDLPGAVQRAVLAIERDRA